MGTGLTLTPSGTVNDGNDGNNYTYTFVPVSTGVITAEALTITAVTNTKVYDGTTSAAAVPTITSGSLQARTRPTSPRRTARANVGTGLTLTPSGMVNDGNGGNNYTYTFVPDSTGVITAEALTITAVTNTKIYDGTTSAAASADDHVGQSARLGHGQLHRDLQHAERGHGLTLTPSGTVNDGNGGNNYTYTFVPDLDGRDHAGRIDDHGGGQHQDLRRHDERLRRVPTITSGSLGTGDTANFIETYSTPNVGTGLTLTPSGTVNDGNDGNNYTLHVRAGHDGRDHGRGPDDHGSDQHQGLRRHDERRDVADDHVGQSARLGYGQLQRDVQHGERGHRPDADAQRYGHRRQRRQQLHVHVRAGVDGRDHGRGPDDHGGDQHQGLRRHDERLRRCRRSHREACKARTWPTSARRTARANVGTGLTLTPSGMVGDGNGGNNYTYTFVPDSTGVITAEALTMTAVTNTKVYDGTTSSLRECRRSRQEVCKARTRPTSWRPTSTRNVGSGLTLTPSGTVNDGNGGNNYTYTFVPDVTGVDHAGRIDDHGGGQHQGLRRND